MEKGFQLPDATVNEGDICGFTMAWVQGQQVPDVDVPQCSLSLLLILPIASVWEPVHTRTTIDHFVELNRTRGGNGVRAERLGGRS